MENTEKNEILLALKEVQEQMDQGFSNTQQQIDEIRETQQEMKKQMDQGFSNMQQQIDDMKIDIRQINKSVAVIEHDHGEKLSALFDAFTSLSEKLESHEDKINSNQAHLERHDDEIYYLKSRVQGV